MATSLTIGSTVLKRVIRVVAPATDSTPAVPTHFSETVLVEGNAEGEVKFSCCDGFRLHEVTLFKGMAEFDAPFQAVFGVGWLQDILKECGKVDHTLELSAEVHPDARTFVDMWETSCWIPPLFGYDPASDQPRYERPLRFDIGGRWPKTDSLIDYDEVVEGAIGFNPEYFSDMVKAAMAWWDREADRNKALPLVVQQMQAEKVCTFKLRNSIGRLRVALMPKIMREDEF